MKLSKKGEYALKALIELAINYEKGKAVTLIEDIATKKGIPQKYLEQILLGLKNSGILEARRGVGGGYALSRPPERISLGEIIRTVDGPLAPINCVSVRGHVDCPEESTCGLYSVMLEVRNAVANVLDNTTLKDVARRTVDLMDANNRVPNYAI